MLDERFWSKVHKTSDDSCWLWLAAKSKGGYGQFKIGNAVLKPHRLVFEELVERIKPGNVIMHLCDNPLCVNPSHLRQGTVRDNNIDRDLKGRQVSLRGESHKNSKLNEDAVREIHEERDRHNAICSTLAERHGVSFKCIKSVVSGKTWTWLV